MEVGSTQMFVPFQKNLLCLTKARIQSLYITNMINGIGNIIIYLLALEINARQKTLCLSCCEMFWLE